MYQLGAEIAVEIRAERSSPRVGPGTNCRGSVGNSGGFSQTLSRLSLFMAGAVAAFCGTTGNGCPSDRMDENIYANFRI